MRQADFLAAQLPKRPRAKVFGGSARKAKDWEGVLAFQIRSVLAPLGFPLPVGRGFGNDQQFQFASPLQRKFTVDYAWPNERLLVEVQGGLWVGGAHARGWGVERDCEKAQLMALLGYTLIPVTEKDIRSGRALELIQLVLERLGCKPGLSATAPRVDIPPAAGRTSPAPACDPEFDDELP
jgi:very-short-patch-repair endonuclease